MNDQSQQPIPQGTHGQRLVAEALHTHPDALRRLHPRGSAEDELAKLVVRAARQLDNLQGELVDRCSWAATDLTRVAAGTMTANALGVLQNSATQIDILAARRADAITYLKSVVGAYHSATTASSPQRPGPQPAPTSTAVRRTR